MIYGHAVSDYGALVTRIGVTLREEPGELSRGARINWYRQRPDRAGSDFYGKSAIHIKIRFTARKPMPANFIFKFDPRRA